MFSQRAIWNSPKSKGNLPNLAETMVLTVYALCQQLILFLCANVCDQQHQSGAKLKAVHTDKFIMKHQLGAPAAIWKAY